MRSHRRGIAIASLSITMAVALILAVMALRGSGREQVAEGRTLGIDQMAGQEASGQMPLASTTTTTVATTSTEPAAEEAPEAAEAEEAPASAEEAAPSSASPTTTRQAPRPDPGGAPEAGGRQAPPPPTAPPPPPPTAPPPTAPAPTSPPPPAPTGPRHDNSAEATIASMLNQYRASKDLPALAYHSGAQGCARRWTQTMVANGDISHGSCPDQLFNTCGACNEAGENVGVTTSSAANVFEAWKNSPSHNASMLMPGSGVYGVGAYWKGGELFITLVVGRY